MPVDSHPRPGPRPPLSERQRQVLGAIQGSLRSQGCPPTIRELAGQLGLRSTNGVACHLAALERKGYLHKRANKSRTWRPVDDVPPPGASGETAAAARRPSRRRAAAAPAQAPRIVPLVGQVAAGLPALAIEQAEDTLAIDPYLLPRCCRDVFALCIVGESMCEAGIHPGDIVLVERREDARPGAIVVALLGDEATVKRYRPDAASRTVRLEPANAAMAAIVLCAEEAALVRIIGVVVGVWRRL